MRPSNQPLEWTPRWVSQYHVCQSCRTSRPQGSRLSLYGFPDIPHDHRLLSDGTDVPTTYFLGIPPAPSPICYVFWSIAGLTPLVTSIQPRPPGYLCGMYGKLPNPGLAVCCMAARLFAYVARTLLGRMSICLWGPVSTPSSQSGVEGTRKGRDGRGAEVNSLWRLWASANSALNAQRRQYLDQLSR